jgi:hypothetical protein
MRVAIAMVCVIGCTSSGALELDLELPSTPDLKPSGMTTITVLATSPDIAPTANTSRIASDGSFSAGEFPVADDVSISVLLRNDSNRLVGIGEAASLVDIVGDDTTSLTIPVRKPFIYAGSGTSLYSFDATLDPRDAKFQGELPVSGAQIAVSVGGDRLVVANANQLQVVDTATHAVAGKPIPLGSVTIADVAPVPGTHRVVVAHSQGIAIVDLDSAMVTPAMVGPVDRVTVGAGSDGKPVAYGLVGRVAPPENPLVACTGSSMLVSVPVDNPGAMTAPKPIGDAVSDIAATMDTVSPKVFASLPCSGMVAQVTGTVEGGQLALMKLGDLPNAAVLAVAGERVIAAGSEASIPKCETGAGSPTNCTPSAAISCPEMNATHVAYVVQGARTIIQSYPVAGGSPLVLSAPERRETMIDTSDPAEQHTEVLHAFSAVPLDLVVLPGGQYVSIATKSRYYLERLDGGFSQVLIPCLDATTYNWLLFDLASASVAQRIRTECDLTQTPGGTVFGPFACDMPPEGESSTRGAYKPISVGALFGAR